MTWAIGDRTLKNADCDIRGHVHSHIHLTNFIHLKNHMHKQSPILYDSSLTRDLVALQRTRSLRDPSASPAAWPSPHVAELLSKTQVRETASGRRRSTVIDRARDGRRLSTSSHLQERAAASKVAGAEVNGVTYGAALRSEQCSKTGARDRGATRIREKESGVRNDLLLGGNEGPSCNKNIPELTQGIPSVNSEIRVKKSSVLGKQGQEADGKMLSQQLGEIPVDSNDLVLSYIQQQRSQTQHENTFDEPEPCFRASCAGLARVKRRKFLKIKRPQAPNELRHTVTHNKKSVASNSSVHASFHHRRLVEKGEDRYAQENVAGTPKNSCGIPWNWSRIHDRGKSFLGIAGRSLSCGRPASHARDKYDLQNTCYSSSTASRSDAEALPLLVSRPGSQGSIENAAWAHDYSGELGIFANSLLKCDTDSVLASEGRSGDQRMPRAASHGRHQNLTQKYMPRTFRDLVGQNLVAQALSNAVVRRKVGLLYVFYGPRGTGKTSCARIFARAINCQSLDHPKPCGFCGSCVAHNMGKSRNIKEVGPVTNFGFESIMDLLHGMAALQKPSHYKLFIFDDCDTLSPGCWSAISKAMDQPPRHLVFILICSSLDVLPHGIKSRCQKIFFPKLRHADIIYGLQWIAAKEGLKIDKDALKLIASRSDGSLRDAEMTLEQLSLLGKQISVTLVQELIGLISDEKLVDLLDMALSADTVNTVKNLREIMETCVEPLALISQLAMVITDILAGSYDFTKERHRRKFFRRQALSKEEMEKLRQALRTLSEAEKQLRMSDDKLTWLTAALLQLAPDQQYTLPGSAEDASSNYSPLATNNKSERHAMTRKSSTGKTMMQSNRRGLENGSATEKHHLGDSVDTHHGSKGADSIIDGSKHVGRITASEHTCSINLTTERVNDGENVGEGHKEIDEIWLEVLEQIQINCIKEFLYKEGKLMSICVGTAPAVHLMFSSPEAKSQAEKYRAYMIQAFECVLESPMIIEIWCESRKEARTESNAPLVLPTSENGSSYNWISEMGHNEGSRKIPQQGVNTGTSEIVEMAASLGKASHERADNMEMAWVSDTGCLRKETDTSFLSRRRRLPEQNRCQSIVRSKVSLAHVIQQAEGSTYHSAWIRRKSASIAEKLEQENLRLESRSRSFLCCGKTSRLTRRKLSQWRIRTRRLHSLLKLVSCGRCMPSRSPRKQWGCPGSASMTF